MITDQVNRKLLQGNIYDVVILDINSLFLFGGSPPKRLYEFIANFKKISGHDTVFINVIDNGLNEKMLKRFPHYKANRVTSKARNSPSISRGNTRNKFKRNIDAIYRTDKKFPSNLTFHLTGESDFKIGFILGQIHQYTSIPTNKVLTIANDKDMVLASIMSDVILKRSKAGKQYQFFFKNKTEYLPQFKEVFKLDALDMRNISDYFYYLMLNGDKLDNVKQIFTKGRTISYLNQIQNKYDDCNLMNICSHLSESTTTGTCDDVMENSYLIDIFNQNTFTRSQRSSMSFLLTGFFNLNGITVKTG